MYDLATEEELLTFFQTERNVWMKDILPWHIGLFVVGLILVYFLPNTFSLAWIGFCFCARYFFVEVEFMFLRIWCLVKGKASNYFIKLTARSQAEGIADLLFVVISCLLVIYMKDYQ
jgi:hypothetical protein